MQNNAISKIEAFIFSAKEPISLKEICKAVDINKSKVRDCIDNLKKEYSKEKHGIILKEFDQHYIFKTKSKVASIISDYYEKKREVKLSNAALETLAIIAYRQPVTRAEIEEIRGVKVEKTLLTLGKYELIEELGRKDTIGNPIVYGTTDKFLEDLDISNLSELPPLEEVN